MLQAISLYLHYILVLFFLYAVQPDVITDWSKFVAMRYGVNKLEFLEAKCSRRSSGTREDLKRRKKAAFMGISQVVLIPTYLFIHFRNQKA